MPRVHNYFGGKEYQRHMSLDLPLYCYQARGNALLPWKFREFISYCLVTLDRLRQKKLCKGHPSEPLVGKCLPLRLIAHSLLTDQHVFALKLRQEFARI